MRESLTRAAGPKTSQARELLFERPPGERAIRLPVFLAGATGNFLRQSWRGRLFVPMDGLQIIAHILFVVRGLRVSRLIGIGRPKPRRVRRQYLVGQDDLASDQPKLELGVRNDDTALPRVIGGAVVQLQREITQLGGGLLAHRLHCLLERNILIMSGLGLGGGRVYRLGQDVRFAQSGGKRNAANRARPLIILPAGASQISS